MGPPPRPFVVVVTGSECTGKTTLAADLSAEFDASWSPEFARSYVDAKQAPLDASDVEPIAAGQLAVERAADHHAAARQARVVVRDTDLVSTTVYARHYYGSCPAWIAAAARRRAGDLYLLLCPDVPWMPDGLQRDRPDDAERVAMHARFCDALASVGARVVEIRGSWADRRRQAFAAVAAAVPGDYTADRDSGSRQAGGPLPDEPVRSGPSPPLGNRRPPSRQASAVRRSPGGGGAGGPDSPAAARPLEPGL